MLLSHEVDIASVFAVHPKGDPRVRFKSCRSGRLYLLVNRAHRLAAKPQASVDDLRDERFVTMGPAHALHWVVMEACLRHGFSPSSYYSESHFLELAKQVDAGLGVSYYPVECPAPYGMQNVACLPFDEPLTWYFGCAIRKETLPSEPAFKLWEASDSIGETPARGKSPFGPVPSSSRCA